MSAMLQRAPCARRERRLDDVFEEELRAPVGRYQGSVFLPNGNGSEGDSRLYVNDIGLAGLLLRMTEDLLHLYGRKTLEDIDLTICRT